MIGQDRRKNLEDAIIFFRFTRECDNFESWMNDKVCASEMDNFLFSVYVFYVQQHVVLSTS